MVRDPHPKAPGIEAGVTEPTFRDPVHEFYARVRQVKWQMGHWRDLACSWISADVELLPPTKTEKCEVPAPILLRSLGSSPKLVFDPPIEANWWFMA